MPKLSKITVNAFWDDEASVWVAESDDVPGLITEAETLEELSTKLEILIPELLELNLGEIPRGELPIHLKAERHLHLAR